MEFLENGSQNGLGFLVVAVLFYLFVFFLIQYFQHEKRFYLWYSLYAVVNGISLMRHVKGVFFTDFFESSEGLRFSMDFHYPAQYLGTVLFTYFVVEIMRLRESFPKSIRIIDYYYGTSAAVYLILSTLFIFDHQNMVVRYYHAFVHIPLGYGVFFWTLFMVFNKRMIIKPYILSGMLVLGISYLLLFITTIKEVTVDDQYLYIFYIGILVESLLFALAIGLEQKMVYIQNVAIQKKLVSQLEENQIIKNGINRALSEELELTKSSVLELSEEAQRERTEKLTLKFENKFSQLRLDALRSQMNPHFIFNALNSIKSYLILNDQERAVYYLGRFSKLIRSLLENSRKEEISLAEELKTLKMYMEIEGDRFKNDMAITIDVDKSLDVHNIKVPALFLQPFVENAIWHGLTTKRGKKELNITVYKTTASPKCISIQIEDNGIGRQATQKRNAQNPLKKESLGLKLITDRLELFSKKNGKNYSFQIKDLFDDTGKATGTVVEIKVPYESNEILQKMNTD
ncbi:histidine kinase [Croceitalea marina]|uniref:Histidine kinase n=1 Tax=Croceitalea marina TaxID=1775166 RepID=A0ABW5MWI9_9FLAO